MAFHGDLQSFPLPDLLQHLASSRKTGSLQLTWEGGERKLFILSGRVTATSSAGLYERIARMLSLAKLAEGDALLAALHEMKKGSDAKAPFLSRKLDPAAAPQLAREELFGAVADLTTAENGRFHWAEDADRSGEEWVPVEIGLSELLFEALRWMDEQPEVERALSKETMVVRTIGKASAKSPLLYRVILALCAEGVTLGRLRLAMGISRSTANRRVFDLLRLKLVSVDGAPALEADPVADMLEKGAVLVQEEQYEAAGLVFSALLASDPADRRVREFALMVGREHTAALYRDLPPLTVFTIRDSPDALSLLRPEERHVASLLNGKWDVSTVVLASQVRELETLKTLQKLRRMGLLQEG